jgi:hypothetical protein
LAVRLLLQGWSEKYDCTKEIILAIRLYQSTEKKPCGGDFSLHRQDLTLQESKGNRHTFARPITASGTLRETVCKE